MLVDSSVWIPYLRGDVTAAVEILVDVLNRRQVVWLDAPILQEVLRGADGPRRFARWERILGELPLLIGPEARVAARGAAHLYARCRWAGITPRSANDCLIAVHAISHGVPLLHSDRDFSLISKIEPKLRLLPARAGKDDENDR